jgi:hypothetical protein
MTSSLQARWFWGVAVLALLTPVLASCGSSSSFGPAMPAGALSGAQRARPANASSWKFSTLDNPNNLGFNELLGINNVGKICGFDGIIGSKKTPARSYCIEKYGKASFRNFNYPGALDTVITSANSAKAIAGWYINRYKGWIFGCIYANGIWSSYRDPLLNKSHHSNITVLLGISQSGLAVGFYTDDYGVNHAFELDTSTGRFHAVKPPGGVSVAATGINGKGDIVGVMTTLKGSTTCLLSGCKGWLLKGGVYHVFSYPKSLDTEALAVNWQDQIVGSYLDASAITHAFVLTSPLNQPVWISIDEPKSVGLSVLTSIQDHDYMVGYYLDSAGKMNGFLATPQY